MARMQLLSFLFIAIVSTFESAVTASSLDSFHDATPTANVRNVDTIYKPNRASNRKVIEKDATKRQILPRFEFLPEDELLVSEDHVCDKLGRALVFPFYDGSKKPCLRAVCANHFSQSPPTGVPGPPATITVTTTLFPTADQTSETPGPGHIALPTSLASVNTITSVSTSSASGSSTPSDNVSANCGPKEASCSLNLNEGKLAGIVLAVFFASSISSVIATLLFVRYRSQRAAVIDHSSHTSAEPRGKTFRAIFANKPRALATGSNRDTTTDITSGPEGRAYFQPVQAAAPVSQIPAISTIGPGSIASHTFPVSPLSDHAPELFEPYAARTHVARGLEVGEASTTRSPHVDDTGAMMTPARAHMANISMLCPPIVPLRFSSLNAYSGPAPQRSSDDDHTFLLTTDDNSANYDDDAIVATFAQEPRSPSPMSKISQDLTQFDPGGGFGGLQQQGQQGQVPISRLSESSVPFLSIGYATSSTSPPPQYQPRKPYSQQQQQQQQRQQVYQQQQQRQQQIDREISQLHIIPQSPSHLQSPIPRRPVPAAKSGFNGNVYR